MEKLKKKAISLEAFICLGLLAGSFITTAKIMGPVNMINTVMGTAHDLLINTVFFIMGVAVLAGALSEILSEFGVISLINKLLYFVIYPLYRLPGASALAIVTTYISDNPAVLSLAANKEFRKYFKNYQFTALTNLGTSFGMGFIVSAFMVAQGGLMKENLFKAVLIGNLRAVVGSIISVNLMLHYSKKYFKSIGESEEEKEIEKFVLDTREIRRGSIFGRFLEAMLEGGKVGVDMGIAIIPGVIIICTTVLMLTNGMPQGGYTGAAYEGIGILPIIGAKLNFILKPLFGFTSPQAIAFPITALGAVGAAIGLVPQFIKEGVIGPREIAVFTSMGMCWSGYLSTHVAMMDSLKYRELTGKAIFSHTIGGLAAGMAANFLYSLFV
ncbi:CD0519/CD1768 family membrane protein [Fusobacterium ulcerans]|uniref:CD0519/CD1768 family membrane protein n=1 Tax=Fusobacterium ulcerans TaxID=861 RepID=UPI0030B35827